MKVRLFKLLDRHSDEPRILNDAIAVLAFVLLLCVYVILPNDVLLNIAGVFAVPFFLLGTSKTLFGIILAWMVLGGVFHSLATVIFTIYVIKNRILSTYLVIYLMGSYLLIICVHPGMFPSGSQLAINAWLTMLLGAFFESVRIFLSTKKVDKSYLNSIKYLWISTTITALPAIMFGSSGSAIPI